MATQDPLDNTFNKVLNHPSFSHLNRATLSRCEGFCDAISAPPHEDVVTLKIALNKIAMATDNPNEASGFLFPLPTLGGGLSEQVAPDSPFNNLKAARLAYPQIPISHIADFTEWATQIPSAMRALAYTAATDALIKRKIRIRPHDYSANLVHANINTLLYYILCNVESCLALGNMASQNLNSDFTIAEQIPAYLWEAFNSRPPIEIKALIEHWWGPKAEVPHDFFIALEWQRVCYINTNKGKHYAITIAEFIFHHCEPAEPDFEPNYRQSYGIQAITKDPFLADDIYQAITQKPAYCWLISHNIPHRAAYLNSLFSAGALERPRILAALNSGIAQQWDKRQLKYYQQLRELIAG